MIFSLKYKGAFGLLLFYLCCFTTQGQTYYSKRLNLVSKPNTTQSLILSNDTLYCATQIEETPLPNLSFTSSLLKVDLGGNVLNQKRFKNSGEYYTSALDVVKIKNCYYETGNTGLGNQVVTGLNKFVENGDTLRTYAKGDTSYYFVSQKIFPCTKSKDKLLVFGVTDSTTGPPHSGGYKTFVRLLDTNGVLYQTKLFTSTFKYRSVSAVDTSEDKGYLVSFSEYSFSGSCGTNMLLKLDSNLNQIWSVPITTTSGGYAGVVNHNNQFYYVATSHVDSSSGSYCWERRSLSKISKTGAIIWQKYFGVKQLDINVASLVECANSDLIMCGAIRTGTNEIQGYLLRTDSSGNVKWMRNYRPFTTPLDTVADNYLWDLVQLSDGSFAATGWAGNSAMSSLQQTWILRVDTNGCLGSGNCPPNLAAGIDEWSTSNSIKAKAYPNPFNDNVNVSYVINGSGVIELKLTDATGRVLEKKSSNNMEDTVAFTTNDLAPGVYFINISRGNKSLTNIKLVNITR